MTSVRKPQVWFLTGSQHLYGREALDQVADQSAQIQRTLAASGGLSAEIVGQPVLTESAAIRRVMLEANADPDCLGVIAWMHTFSPAKMWITGLDVLRKPLLYLSLYLKTRRADYYRLLQEVRERGAWEAWLEFFLDGVEQRLEGERLARP